MFFKNNMYMKSTLTLNPAMKTVFAVLLFTILSLGSIVKGQSNHTVTFTGNATDFNAAEKYSAAANSTDYYVTFDATNLYIGAFRTSGSFGSTDNFAVFVDTDPNATPTSGTGTTTGNAYNSVTATLPFTANYSAHLEQGYQEQRTYSGGAWGTNTSPSNYVTGTAREITIPWSTLGNPDGINVTLFMGYAGGVYSNAPGANVGASGTPAFTGYFGTFCVKNGTIGGVLPIAVVNTPVAALTTVAGTTLAAGTYGDITFTGTSSLAGNITLAPGAVVTVSSGTTTSASTYKIIKSAITSNTASNGITIASGATFAFAPTTASATMIYVNNITVNGTLTATTAAATAVTPMPLGCDNFVVNNGGAYTHAMAGTSVNGAATDFPGTTSRTLGASSTVTITQWGTTGNTGLTALPSGVTWGNLTINIATAVAAAGWQQGGALTNIAGNFTLTKIGSTARTVFFTNTTTTTLTIGGNLTVSAGTLTLTNGANNCTVNVGGTFSQGGGTMNLSTGAGTANLNVTGTFTQSAGTIDAVGAGGATAGTGNITSIGAMSIAGTVNLMNSSSGITASITVGNGSNASSLTITGSGVIFMEPVASTSGSGTVLVYGNFIANGTGNGSTFVVDWGAGSSVQCNGNSITIKGNFNHSGSGEFYTAGGTLGVIPTACGFIFAGTGTQTYTETSSATSEYTCYTINSGSTLQLQNAMVVPLGATPESDLLINGTLDCQTYQITGGDATYSTFNLASGGTLKTANTAGVAGAASSVVVSGFGTGLAIFNSAANYIFNGAAAQTANFSNTTMNNLTISNSTGVTLSAATTVNGALAFTAGLLKLSTFNLTNNGTISGYGSSSYIQTASTGQLIQTVGSSQVLYPVGNTAYDPFWMTNSGTSGTFGLICNTFTSGTAYAALNNNAEVVNRSWTAYETTAGGAITPKAQWNSPGEEASGFAAGITPYFGMYGSAWSQVAATLASPTMTASTSFAIPATATAYVFAVGKDNCFNTSPASIAIASANPAVASGNITQSTTNNILYAFTLIPTLNSAIITGLTIPTTGTYATADLTNLKLWYQTTSTFTGSGTVLSTMTTPGTTGTLTFPSFVSQSIASGATGYFFVTADLPCSTVGNTIAVSAITSSNLSFSVTPSSYTGTAYAGGTQSIVYATPSCVTSPVASPAAASAVVTWTAPTCYSDVMVVVSPATNTGGTPTGSGYGGTSLTYGSGTAFGNGYIVYEGISPSQTVTGLTNGTTYYVKWFVRNGTNWVSCTETPVTPVVAYCSDAWTSSANTGKYIKSISSSGGVTNLGTQTYTTKQTNGYLNSTAVTPTISQYPGGTFSISMAEAGGTEAPAVYVDWSRDGTFTDLGDTLLSSTSYSVGTTAGSVGTFTVPPTALPGTTRIRIIGDELNTSPSACTATAYSNCYDFTITVLTPPAPTITSLGTSSGCPGSTLVINGTNLTGATTSSVTIGGTAVSSITSNTGTVLTVVTGSGTTGTVSVTTSGGTATGGTYTFNSAPVITGNPSATSVNALASATATMTAATSTSSPTYQWQYATSTSGPWTNVADGTPAGITYSGTGTSATLSAVSTPSAAAGSAYYECVITAGGCSSTTTSALLTINGYCESTGTGTDAYITNVTTTGGITNINNTSTFTTGGYNYYNALSPTIDQVAGGTLNFTSSIYNIAGGVCFGIFVDWNNNGVFTDPGENVYVSGSSQIFANPSGSFTVPGGQASGNYRMRVVVNYSGTVAASCNSGIDGETEDYVLAVVTPCITFSPSAPTICSGTPTTITASGGTGYTWSTSATTASITVSPTTTTVYSVTPTGSCTVPSSVTVTVNAAPSAVTVTPSTTSICMGATTTLTASGGTTTIMTQGFESGTPPAGWANLINGTTSNYWGTANYVNTTSATTAPGPHTGTGVAEYDYNLSYAAKAYLISPGLSLVGGTTYTITYWEVTYGTGYTEKLQLTVGTSQTVAAQTGGTVITATQSLTNGAWVQKTATYTPSTSGTYYFSWNCLSAANQYWIALDDITITASSSFTWNTNITSLYTDAAATIPYTTSTIANVVYAKPTATQTYTATSTNASSCTAANTSVVTVTANSWTGTTSTDWNVGTNWCSGTVPTSSSNVIIPSGTTYQPTIGPSTTFAAVCNNITINSGATLTMSNTSSLTISGGATFQNNGTFSPAAGTTVVFAGGGTVNGSNATTFSNLTLNAGTLSIPTTGGLIPTISGTLLINNGNLTAPPIYGSSSTLEYNVTYNRFSEWSASGVGTIGTTPGYPNNVLINAGTFDVYNSASGVIRALAGTLTVTSGATMNFNGMNAAFYAGGNIVVGGTMNMNTMSAGLTGGGYLQINSGGALNMNTMSSSINIATNIINNGTLALSTASGGDIYLSGNWTRGSAATFTPNARAVFFTGSGTEVVTVTSGGTETFNYLIVGGSGTMQIASGTTVWVNYSGGLSLNSSNTTSTIDLNGQTMILFGGGNLNLNTGNKYITSSTGTGTFQINSNLTTVSNAGTLTFQSGTILDLQNGFDGGVSGVVHMNGTLRIDAGGYWANTGHAPTYGAGSILNYNNGTTYTSAPSSEWYENTVSQPGVPYNVVISTSGSELDFNSSGYKHEMWGDLTINTGTTLALHGGSGNAGADFYIKGNWYNYGTFTGNGRMVAFNGAAAQTLTGATSFDYFQITNSAGLTINNDITITAVGYLTTGIITTGTNKVITSSTSGGALSGQSSSSYILGNVQRAVAALNSYDFPMGDATHYQLATITLNTTSGMSYISGKFTTGLPATGPSSSTCSINGTPITGMLSGGYWTLTPDAGSANYDITLNGTGYSTTPSPYHFGVIKRHDATYAWTGTDLAGTNGYHSNANSSISGGVISTKRTGVTTFSDYGIGTSSSYALPVTLIYFDAANKDGNGLLTWATASETDNDHFDVERSTDGVTFEKIGQVAGHDNSTVTINYDFTDPDLASHGVSVLYYRLKQVDVDGDFDNTNIVSVDVANVQQVFHVISTYPNPFADHFSVSFFSPGVQTVKMSVYDVRGALVSEETISASEGMNVYSIPNASKLPAGFYTMNVNAGDKSYGLKMLKGDQ